MEVSKKFSTFQMIFFENYKIERAKRKLRGLTADERIDGINALERTKSQKIVLLLVETLFDSTFPAVQASAARALGRMKDPAAVESLAKVASSTYWLSLPEKKFAYAQCGFSAEETARWKSRDEESVRVAALRALASIGTPAAWKAISASQEDRLTLIKVEVQSLLKLQSSH